MSSHFQLRTAGSIPSCTITFPVCTHIDRVYTQCRSRQLGVNLINRKFSPHVIPGRRDHRLFCQPAQDSRGTEEHGVSSQLSSQESERLNGQSQPRDRLDAPATLVEGAAAQQPQPTEAASQPPLSWLTGFFWAIIRSLSEIRVSFKWDWNWLESGRRKRCRQLHEAWKNDPKNVEKMAALMTELTRQKRYSEALKLVHDSTDPIGDAVVGEYLKALVKSDRISQFMVPGQLRKGEDHRSLLELLKELGSKAEGASNLALGPGATATRPLHIIMQEPKKGAGGFLAILEGILAGFMSCWLALVSIGLLFMLGSAAVSKTSSTSSPLSPGLPTGLASSSSLSSSSAASGYAPKEYVKEAVPEKSQKTFKDVKGCNEAKAELQEIVEFLKNPDKFTRLGGKLPKGVLLTGPPGTGKTLLAKAVAGEAGVPFFFRAGSEFEEMFVGVGSRRVRALFAAAKKKTPCIVFIDEIDAVGASRKMWENHTRKTLNQLLVEMDGFESTDGIIVIAATNLQESLDPALTRPGRFDRHVAVPLPDVRGRLEILNYYMEGKPLSPEVDAAALARRTPGFSGADLSNMVNESALLAAKTNADVITPAMLDEARDKILMGAERRSLVQSSESRKLTAYHESGHALVALNTVGAKPIHKATIVPRGHALGMVSQVPDKDEYNVTKQQIMADIDVSMGGKVAEELIFGPDQVTTGARSDLQHATQKARHLVMECGMSDVVGPMFVERDGRHPLSSDTAKTVDAEIGRILRESYDKVKALLKEKEAELHKLAQALLDHETLTQSEIREVLAGTFTRQSVGTRDPSLDYESFISNPTAASGHAPQPAHPD